MAIEGSYQGFDVELDASGVGVLTFNHPERLNAISAGARRDLAEVLTLAQFDDDLRVLVLTGTGKGFMAGIAGSKTVAWNAEPPSLVPAYSIRRGEDSEDATMTGPRARNTPITRYDALTHLSQNGARSVRRLDKLTIAAVNGYAIQWGLSLALACDFVIAGRS